METRPYRNTRWPIADPPMLTRLTRLTDPDGGRTLAFASVLALLITGPISNTRAGEDVPGAKIYKEKCAWCHGDSGEGTEDFHPRPLQGDRSVEQLAKLIAKTMPQDEPEACVGKEAEEVAAYIYDAFYSPLAQARNRPARIELSRLTVRQYRNALTDLIGSFRSPGDGWGETRGLKGEYFNARGFRGRGRVYDRVDPEVRFDFGVTGPGPEPDKFEPNQFSIRWQGSVLATETGEYEFIVRTEHAARLWVNDNERPLIDAWVKSGDDTEFRGSITLLGGRAYPIRLEFSKAKQGVDDSKKQKGKPPEVKASISLSWKPPKRVEEILPSRNLSPDRSPERFVLETPFPPDDRSVGYERGTSVSKAWDEATTEAAIEVADYVTSRLEELAKVQRDAKDREAKLRDFCARFTERAFRKPLTDEQKALYVQRQFQDAPDLESAVKRVVMLTLKSPRFLYREIDGGQGPYEVASRISFGLWDSLPDEELLKAAAEGRLSSREQVVSQVERMLPDRRTRSKVREFLHEWLKIAQVPDVSKDAALFPGFDEAIASDLRTSLDLFLDDVVWGEGSDFRRFLLDNTLYLNGRLAKFYGAGADLPADAPFQKVAIESEDRAGVLSHPYLMAAFAYNDTSSPIHRGVFLARNVLGRALRPPPAAFAPLAPDLHPNLNTRERVALQTSPEMCQNCHGMINALGFSLEHFDAIGRYRQEEKSRPIDASGSYQTPEGKLVTFEGARGLATYLATSEETHAAFVNQLFHYLVKQPILAYGSETPSRLRQSFESSHDRIQSLIVEIVVTSALKGWEPGAGASTTVSAD